jgi:hypothetical protein
MDEQPIIDKPKQTGGTSKKNLANIEACLKRAIQPIIEFFPVDRSNAEKPKLVPTDENNFNKKLQKTLKDSPGIYLFYNSEGKVIYVGKTKKNLWAEMNSVFNRDRPAQKIKDVKHPIHHAFKPAFAKQRRPKERPVRLFDITAYFSAYQVDPSLIGNLEALLIRALPNNLVNIKMETFKYF